MYMYYKKIYLYIFKKLYSFNNDKIYDVSALITNDAMSTKINGEHSNRRLYYYFTSFLPGTISSTTLRIILFV